VYTYDGKSTCFIGNAHQSKDATINFRNNEYTIPAWSVSILPNCSSEAYNTAKVMRIILKIVIIIKKILFFYYMANQTLDRKCY